MLPCRSRSWHERAQYLNARNGIMGGGDHCDNHREYTFLRWHATVMHEIWYEHGNVHPWGMSQQLHAACKQDLRSCDISLLPWRQEWPEIRLAPWPREISLPVSLSHLRILFWCGDWLVTIPCQPSLTWVRLWQVRVHDIMTYIVIDLGMGMKSGSTCDVLFSSK